MKEKIKNYLPLVLATLAVLQLLGGWARFTGDEMFTDRNSPFYSNKITTYEIQNDLRSDIEYQRQIGQKWGIDFKTDKILQLVQYFHDGKLTAEELDYTAGIVNPIIKKTVKFYKNEIIGISTDDSIENDVRFLSVLRILLSAYHIVYIASWVIFLLYAFDRFTHKIGFIRPLFPIVMVVNVALFIVTIVFINLNLNATDYYLETKLTLRPFLTLLLLIPESIYLPFVDKLMASGKVETALAGAGEAVQKGMEAAHVSDLKKSIIDTFAPGEPGNGLTGWTCPHCGNRNSSGSRFCSSCGKSNPNVATCPKCGKELKDHEAFCPDCGAPIHWEPVSKKCPNCGTENPLDSSFCENYGAPLKRNAVNQ
ncbi:MAG: zinc ribbon domain-containing protein [Erysipelotrichaceae bacterium]|nr:zinc ribbon domain-containing protein [Erysipelotrichaceae bacterium]